MALVESSLPATPKLTLNAADLHGAARLLADATVGVVDIVEAMHHTIASRAGILGAAPPGRTRGITGFVYGVVRGSARLAGRGMDAAWDALAPDGVAAVPSPDREAAVAALNGVWGDHLAATANKLAIQMRLRVDGRSLDLAAQSLQSAIVAPRPKLIVLVHGLCLSDLQWRREEHDHGAALARDLDASAVYLHYNTGRHVSENGRLFSALLEELVANWPVPVEELIIVGHSMGGLVARSAHLAATAAGAAWTRRLAKMVFLGTPHHGAVLERGGMVFDTLLGVSPYTAPFARLGKARSAGITDLRFGNLRDRDWQDRDRHAQRHDDRQPAPLPEDVACFIVAATLSETAGGARGDGLVPLASALGEHENAALGLRVPSNRIYVATKAGHFDLLNRPDVYRQIRSWL